MSNLDPIFPEEKPGVLARILPPLVLIGAFGGFLALAIYAYQAGTESVDENELMVVEAENTPMKEKPQDPGGMQFPNQDKTIFETFSSTEQAQPNVERVLPTPEEPMVAGNNTADSTWVNDKITIKDSAPNAPEQVFSDAEITSGPKVVNIQEELGKQAVALDANIAPSSGGSEAAPVELKTKEALKEVVKEVVAEKPVEVKPVEISKPEAKAEEKPEAKTVEKPKAAKVAASGGKQLVQLGAYKDEAAAKADFKKLQKKHAALAGKSANIVRADLGDKGIYYRLRVATDDAKKLCASLAGQACLVVR